MSNLPRREVCWSIHVNELETTVHVSSTRKERLWLLSHHYGDTELARSQLYQFCELLNLQIFCEWETERTISVEVDRTKFMGAMRSVWREGIFIPRHRIYDVSVEFDTHESLVDNLSERLQQSNHESPVVLRLTVDYVNSIVLRVYRNREFAESLIVEANCAYDRALAEQFLRRLRIPPLEQTTGSNVAPGHTEIWIGDLLRGIAAGYFSGEKYKITLSDYVIAEPVMQMSEIRVEFRVLAHQQNDRLILQTRHGQDHSLDVQQFCELAGIRIYETRQIADCNYVMEVDWEEFENGLERVINGEICLGAKEE